MYLVCSGINIVSFINIYRRFNILINLKSNFFDKHFIGHQLLSLLLSF